MRSLVLVRHAKTEPGGPGVADAERQLTERGHRDAAIAGDWLAAHGPAPDLALVSTAERARQTWSNLSDHLVTAPRSAILRDLYLAPAERILSILQRADEEVVLIVGHNDGLANFARAIVKQPPAHQRFGRYPTGALSVIVFDVEDWALADWGGGRCDAFMIPAELT